MQDKKEQQRKSSEFVSSLLRLPYKTEKTESALTAPPVLKAPVTPSDINKMNVPKLDIQASAASKMIKFTKLSQKERKRLNSLNSEQSLIILKSPLTDQNDGIDKPKWSGWGKNSSCAEEAQRSIEIDFCEVEHNTSLENIMKSQSKQNCLEHTNKSTDTSKSKQPTKKPKSWRTLDLNESHFGEEELSLPLRIVLEEGCQ